MSLSGYQLNYTKDWRNAADFPTYETKEAKVREDMQLLFNEMRNAFNRFVIDLSAGLLPFTSSEAVPETNVQAAILNVQQQIGQAVAGDIPNRSLSAAKLILNTLTNDEFGDACVDTRVLDAAAVTTAKIADSAVTTAKIADDAVTGDKIVDYCITESHLASESVTGPKIKDASVGTLKIADEAVTAAKLVDNAVESGKIKAAAVVADKIADGAVTADKLAASAVSEGKIADAAVTAGKIGSNAVSTVYSGTLAAASWLGAAAPYTQDVTINGILATDEPVLDLMPSNTYATAMTEDEEWGYIYRAVTSADTITFYAKEKPTGALNFKARCIRK